jgi:GNAT superfamily N-acetyltransferase
VEDIEFRLMQDVDIDAGLRLCRLAGWDQVHRDWRRFLESPDTILSAAVLRGEIIGTVATIRYGARFGWIGMVLVHPSAQGRGTGAALLREATDRLVDMPATRLDATPAGQPLYRKHGFVDECSLTRMEARSVSIDHRPHSLVRSMTRGELSEVVAMDHEVFGAPRGDLLQWMYDGAPHFAFVAERRRNLCGYVFGRHGHEFDHLGPIVADDLDVAVNLTKAGLAQHRDQAFVIDALHHDESWIRFLESAGFRPQRSFTRMYRGGHASFGLPRQQFAVLGPEFG